MQTEFDWNSDVPIIISVLSNPRGLVHLFVFPHHTQIPEAEGVVFPIGYDVPAVAFGRDTCDSFGVSW